MTSQFCDSLLYNHEHLNMRSSPLGYCDTFNEKAKDLIAESTGFSPRYLGSWEIINDRLYLIGIKARLRNGCSVNLDYFFPGFPDRVFAHWYSGSLSIPKGQCIKYVQMGYANEYEQEQFISVKQGVITGVETITHTVNV